MSGRQILASLVLISITASVPARAGDPEAARSYAAGQAALAQGDLPAALAAFKAATRAEPENGTYFEEARLLKRVIDLRGQLATAPDAEAWQTMAGALYAYYTQHKLGREALPLATQMYARQATAANAAALAGAQIAAGQDAAAITLLAGLPAAQATPQTTALYGLALFHTGKTDDALAQSRQLRLPKDAAAGLCYDAARLYAALGDAPNALVQLKCAFEATPAAALPALKLDAQQAPEFKTLTAKPEFATALETKSKVAAGCGAAGGCGGCSKAKSGGCEHEQAGGDEAGGDKAGCEHGKAGGKK
jgi:tetratricopeptide (TPR) repeat protein